MHIDCRSGRIHSFKLPVQILELRTKGLISSKRKQGGYALAKTPEQITLLAIVEAVDSGVESFIRIGESGSKFQKLGTVFVLIR